MGSDHPDGGFGARLRYARERRGISLRQIANVTKISIAALEALERNDLSRLPGGIFSRAFVRSYAIEVGLDPDETIQAFLEQFPHDSLLAGLPASNRIDDNELHETNRRMASVVVRLVAVSMPLAGLVIYLGNTGRGDVETRRAASPPAHDAPATPVATAPPAPALPEPEPAVVLPAAAAAAPPVPAPAAVSEPVRAAPLPSAAAPRPSGDRLSVALAASGPCWVLAIADGEQVIARELRAGESEVIDAGGELVLTVGDAAAMQLTLNGAEARPLGRPGQVVTLRLTPANFRTYLPTP